MPTIYIIAGPNGVGKTTFADRYLPDEAKQLEFMNADLTAHGLSPYDPEAAAVEAGKVVLKRIRLMIEQRVGFTWETTLSGKTALRWLNEARQAGFVLKAYFLWVHNPETTIRRVQQRVSEGGHNIPESIVRRRFFKTIQNFFHLYRPLMTDWKLLQNELPGPRLIAVEKQGRLAQRDRKEFTRILREAHIEL